MIRRYIGERLRRAAEQLLTDGRRADLLAGCPVGYHAEMAAWRSQRRYDRWRLLWTVLYGWGANT